MQLLLAHPDIDVNKMVREGDTGETGDTAVSVAVKCEYPEIAQMIRAHPNFKDPSAKDRKKFGSCTIC